MKINQIRSKYKSNLLRTYRSYLRTFGYSKYLSRFLFRIALVGVYIAFSLVALNLAALLLGKSSTFGAFGDFLGGTLNPIFTFLMLLGLIVTIVLQKTELALARKEFSRSADALSSQDKNLSLQRFENTFFKLLDHLDECRNDVCYQAFQRPTLHGRDAIESIYKAFTEYWLCESSQKGMDHVQIFKEDCKTIDGINEVYVNFYAKNHGDDLGQYFRTLYNILRFVHESDGIENKHLYTRLLRAKLSRYELLLIFYNTISTYGQEKLSPLVNEYNLLKHLEKENLPAQNLHIWEEFNA